MFTALAKALNTGCDLATDKFIDRKYMKLPSISAIHPILDPERPALILQNLFLFLLYSAALSGAIYFQHVSSLELIKIDFVLFVNGTHLAFLMQMSLFIMWHSWLKRRHTAELHRIMERDFFDYQEDLSEITKELKADANKQRRRYIICIILIGFAASCAIGLVPIINKNFGTFDYDKVTGGINFNLLLPLADWFFTDLVDSYFFWNSYVLVATAVVALINCTKSFLAIESCLQITKHMKLLIFQVKTIENRAKKMYLQRYGLNIKFRKHALYSQEFMNCYKVCLEKSIQHHQIIVRATNHFNEVFSFYVFIYYLTASVDIAMSMLSTESTKDFPGTTVGAIIMCIVETVFVALFAHMGQSISDLSSEVSDVIYGTPWYYCDAGVKRTIRIFQTVARKPITFSFYDILHINYDSFAKVMHSAYSYYNLVNASK